MIAVNPAINDSLMKTKRYKEKYSLPYSVLFDKSQNISHSFGIVGVPTIVIVDINGIIRYKAHLTPEDFGAHFPDLIKKK